MCAQKPFVSYILVPLYSLYCTSVQEYTASTVFIVLCVQGMFEPVDLNETNNVNIAHLSN